ncbi:MAG: DUF6051 family protein [Bacteroidales bacterium]|jgi:uncharacterized protein YfbU (UPF0304 family)|nr:DUF6051 family protein [Bacteroidales bacterium]
MKKYIDEFKHLKSIENYDKDEILIDEEVVMHNYTFRSNYRSILPGGMDNNKDDFEFRLGTSSKREADIINEMLNKTDAEIMENINFRYHTLSFRKNKKSDGIILMFHGFNEKTWTKYLPWAKYLMEHTGKTIVLFPIAFHMNRAPATWSDTRTMFNISKQRKICHPNLIASSLFNVAISTRIYNKPQRFIWSGLQTYYDVIDFINIIKSCQHPLINSNATIDIFSYSIGSLLAEVLMMTNKNNFFANSKLVSFCGGAVFNRLSPVSKFILDSEASVSLYSYMVEHIESHLNRNKVLAEFLGSNHFEGINFRSMFDYKVFTSEREQKFRNMANRIYAIALKQDSVVPAYEVINTLQGSFRDIPIHIDILDYPYKYKHEDPFPILNNIEDIVNESFTKTFDLISDFLKK